MAGLKAVKDAGPDPKAGKPRPKSDIAFPYYGLTESIAVAKEMHSKAGGACDRAQLAALLDYKSTNSGSFLTRVAAARLFGVIEPDGGKLRVSTRGKAIVASFTPAQADAAKAEAFLAVELFRKVFDMFNGSELPEDAGLKNVFADLGVVKARIVPTIRIMMESAETAGFFKAAGNRRMVMPLAGAAIPPAPPATSSKSVEASREEQPARPYGGGGNGGGGDSDLPPVLMGLLRTLPSPGAALTGKRRKALEDAFKNILAILYPDDGDEVTLA